MREMRWRTSSMLAAFRPLRKRIFGSAKMALKTKLQLLEATARTRLLFNAGACTFLNNGGSVFPPPTVHESVASMRWEGQPRGFATHGFRCRGLRSCRALLPD